MNPRALAGVIAGGIAGAIVFAGFIVLGLIVNERVTNFAPVVILAIAGAYAGWLLGVIVVGAVRGTDESDSRDETTRGVR